jgi:hypothetical protein
LLRVSNKTRVADKLRANNAAPGDREARQSDEAVWLVRPQIPRPLAPPRRRIKKMDRALMLPVQSCKATT